MVINLNTNASDIKAKVKNAAKELFESDDRMGTYIVRLGYSGKNVWAIVLAWMDWDDTNDWSVYGKVAYQPVNSGMQEYDIDWLMPYDEETGEVDDTETSIEPQSVSWDVDYLVKNWLRIAKALEAEENAESYESGVAA